MPKLPTKAVAAVAQHAPHVFELLPDHIERSRIVEDTPGDSTLTGLVGLVDYFVFDVTDGEDEFDRIEGFEVGVDKIVFTEFDGISILADYLQGSPDDPFDTFITASTLATRDNLLTDVIRIEDVSVPSSDIWSYAYGLPPDLLP